MKTRANSNHQESTYQLLVASEEQNRGFAEGFVYFLLLAATVVTIWLFSQEPVRLPERSSAPTELLF